MLWKIYFWFFVVLMVFLYLFASASDIQWKPVDKIFDVSNITAIVAAYGYLYKKNLFSRRVWRLAIPVSIVYWLLYILILDKPYGGYPPTETLDYVLGVLIPLPIYFLAVRYLRAEAIWKKPRIKILSSEYPNWGDKLVSLIFLIVILMFILVEILR